MDNPYYEIFIFYIVVPLQIFFLQDVYWAASILGVIFTVVLGSYWILRKLKHRRPLAFAIFFGAAMLTFLCLIFGSMFAAVVGGLH